ncbi:hypothetical protein NP233_g145 [Leucocoprinus birnbaumii]|uniref:Nephrocystin 3-like N-terminal domain-containing protein n=1 Tax=Leucocoprinus birnbaumii TaxID=56174 RepID=A0AAD5W5X9_9AGAR|nr:hypothetical protein NP233_g145 [Leucocoprinus birnbaumii]
MFRRTRRFFAKLSHPFTEHFSRSDRIMPAPSEPELPTETSPAFPLATASTSLPAGAATPLTEASSPLAGSAGPHHVSSVPRIPAPHDDSLTQISSKQLATSAPLLIEAIQAPSDLPHQVLPTPSMILLHDDPQMDISSNTRPIKPTSSVSPQPPPPDTSMPRNPPTSSSPYSRSRSQGNFNHAHNFTINNAHFTNNNTRLNISPPGSGLKELLNHSMPDAFLNSAARYPPPRCHLGTRKEYIAQITNWALGNPDHDDHEKLVLWLHGPFGVGKSAVAQSSAEELKARKKLLATLFFSRSNVGRDDPLRFVPSIVYQIATQCDAFADIIDMLLRKDPSLIMQSLSTQFQELLVAPLQQIDTVSNELEGRVIIIDGLDECRGTAGQCEIIRIIALSASNHTTPFRWFITSRPEDPIVRAICSSSISPAISRLELPVSRDIDHEILVFLTDEFAKIRENHNLPETWPTEAALTLLVERGAGLWIYVSTIIRFIKDEDTFGPEDQLRIFLEFAESVTNRAGPNNPLAEMDFFYTLILEQIPLSIRTTIRKILLIHLLYQGQLVRDKTDVLCLSFGQFRRACAAIKSVMELQGDSLDSMQFHFYHVSFLDFLEDSARSRELCIFGEFLVQFRQELLERLHFTCSHTEDPSALMFPSALPENVNGHDHYHMTLVLFWRLCCVPDHPIDAPTAISISKIPFQNMFRLLALRGSNAAFPGNYMRRLRPNLPTELRDNVHRIGQCPTPGCTNPNPVLIFGCKENQAIGEMFDDGGLWLHNNQNPPAGQCPCGWQIKGAATPIKQQQGQLLLRRRKWLFNESRYFTMAEWP